MSSTKVALIFVAFAVCACTGSRPTHCERWKGDSEFRCGKDDYPADSVTILNITNSQVTFKVGKWTSRCGHPGDNTSDKAFALGIGQAQTVDFAAAGPGQCNELFVFECKINNHAANCLNTVRVTPN